MERRLSAIFAADMVGYSRLMEADEAGTIERQKSHRRDVIDPAFEKYHGRIVKEMGDGILVEFPSVVNAVSCAMAIQQVMPERETAIAEDRRIAYRIGINLGDVVIESDDLIGDGVNIAARLEQISEPGGICISGTAYDQIDGRFLGEQNLKNISRPIRAYRVSVTGQAGEPASKPALALPDRPSIAVLPFDNMSNDPEQDYFADGMSEDIITELARFHSLFVIARNSSFSYKGQAIDVQDVAKGLGVRYILEGSIRVSGKRARITAQLIDAESRRHIWAERYDRALEDIFAVQDEITKTIVAAIEPEVSAAERDRAYRAPPDNLDAWGMYQKGLWHAYRFSESDNAQARELFGRATLADPKFARALAGLSLTHFTDAFLGFGGDREDSRKLAIETARRSVALDDRDETSHWALGRAFMISREHSKAIGEFEEAVRLSANFAHAHYNLGWTLILDGNAPEGMAYLDTAEQLSPRDPLLFAFQAVRAQGLLQLGQIEQALVEAQRSNRHPNSHEHTRALLVAILSQLDRVEEAKAEMVDILASRPDYSRRKYALAFPFRRSKDLSFVMAGLEKAGMPE